MKNLALAAVVLLSLWPASFSAAEEPCYSAADCECWLQEVLPSGQWRAASGMGTVAGSTGAVAPMFPAEKLVDLAQTGCEMPVVFGFEAEEGLGYLQWSLAPVGESGDQAAVSRLLAVGEAFGDYPRGRLYYGVTTFPGPAGPAPASLLMYLRPGDTKAEPRTAVADMVMQVGPMQTEIGPFSMSMQSGALELEFVGSSEHLAAQRREACRCDKLRREIAAQRENLAAFEDLAFREHAIRLSDGLRPALSGQEVDLLNPTFDPSKPISVNNSPCLLSADPADGMSYLERILEKLGKPTRSYDPDFSIGGRTNPVTCEYSVNRDPAECLHYVIDQAYARHEEVHRNACLAANARAKAWQEDASKRESIRSLGECLDYAHQIEHPVLWAEEEIRAYEVTIDFLEQAFEELCS